MQLTGKLSPLMRSLLPLPPETAVHALGQSLDRAQLDRALDALETALEQAASSRSRFVLLADADPLLDNPDEEAFATLTSPDAPAVLPMLAEQLCFGWSTAHDLPVTVLHVFGAYGPGQANSFLDPLFEAAASGKPLPLGGVENPLGGIGNEVRLTFVDDAAEAVRLALAAPRESEIISVVGSKVAVDELARLVWDAAGCSGALRLTNAPAFPFEKLADSAKAERILGFVPRVPLARGLAETMASHARRS